MDEIAQADGGSTYSLSDTGYQDKLLRRQSGEDVPVGATYYDESGDFYHAGFLKS